MMKSSLFYKRCEVIENDKRCLNHIGDKAAEETKERLGKVTCYEHDPRRKDVEALYKNGGVKGGNHV